MHILQISNGFINSKVHVSLCKNLAKKGVDQTIYCPVRNASEVGKNAFVSEGTDIIHDFVIKPYHRYAYHLKRQAIFQSLQKKVDLKKVNLCQASTLFTDGGVAYKVFKNHHVPYIVAVRSTDVNAFLNRAPHTWPSAKRILLNASKIIFVSPALKEKFCRHKYIAKFLSEIEGKMVIMRNGIDDYWIDNVNREQSADNHQVLYVGTMIRRKNPLLLIQAVLDLKAKFPDIKLNIIGSTGEDEEAVKEFARQNKDTIVYHGQINNKEELLKNYRANSLFVLPSVAETFGLVYLEALSQNEPVVYTKGDGVDGFLDENNGVGVAYPTLENIKDAITRVFINRSNYSNTGFDFNPYRWNVIADSYISIYKEVFSNTNK